MSQQTQEFLTLFARLEKLAAKAAGQEARQEFMADIKAAQRKSSIFHRNFDDLRMYAKLRNVLVHERHESRYLAEPLPELIEHLAKLIGQIEKPALVVQHFKQQIHEFQPGDSMRDVLEFLAKQDFSQTFIRDEGALKILTANTIQRWLGHHASDELIDCTVSVSEVLEYRELNRELIFAPRHTTLVDALDTYDSEKNPHLVALVITEKGRETETPMALLTPSDLGSVTRILEGK